MSQKNRLDNQKGRSSAAPLNGELLGDKKVSTQH